MWTATSLSVRHTPAFPVPSAKAAVDVDKGCTEAYADSDGWEARTGLGGLLSADSDHGMPAGQRRYRLRTVLEHHAAISDPLAVWPKSG